MYEYQSRLIVNITIKINFHRSTFRSIKSEYMILAVKCKNALLWWKIWWCLLVVFVVVFKLQGFQKNTKILLYNLNLLQKKMRNISIFKVMLKNKTHIHRLDLFVRHHRDSVQFNSVQLRYYYCRYLPSKQSF